MQNPFLYAGIGKVLESVGSSGTTKNGLTDIASSEKTEGVAAHDCGELIFAVEFASAPAAGSIIIEKSPTIDGASWETHATIAATDKLFFSWAANARLLGFYRVYNSGTSVNCAVKVNKAIQSPKDSSDPNIPTGFSVDGLLSAEWNELESADFYEIIIEIV